MLKNEKELKDSDDIAKKETVTLNEAANILGLKYHTARNVIMQDKSIGYINYGRKKVWLKEDILNLKRGCYVTPEHG